jgi:hypothetical protein
LRTRHTKIIMVTKTPALAKLEDQKQVFSKTSLLQLLMLILNLMWKTKAANSLMRIETRSTCIPAQVRPGSNLRVLRQTLWRQVLRIIRCIHSIFRLWQEIICRITRILALCQQLLFVKPACFRYPNLFRKSMLSSNQMLPGKMKESALNIQLQDSAIQLRNVKDTVASPQRASRNTVVPQVGK